MQPEQPDMAPFASASGGGRNLTPQGRRASLHGGAPGGLSMLRSGSKGLAGGSGMRTLSAENGVRHALQILCYWFLSVAVSKATPA